jgi:hypothetical protein
MRDGKKGGDKAYDPFAGLDKGSVLQVCGCCARAWPAQGLCICTLAAATCTERGGRGARACGLR